MLGNLKLGANTKGTMATRGPALDPFYYENDLGGALASNSSRLMGSHEGDLLAIAMQVPGTGAAGSPPWHTIVCVPDPQPISRAV